MTKRKIRIRLSFDLLRSLYSRHLSIFNKYVHQPVYYQLYNGLIANPSGYPCQIDSDLSGLAIFIHSDKALRLHILAITRKTRNRPSSSLRNCQSSIVKLSAFACLNKIWYLSCHPISPLVSITSHRAAYTLRLAYKPGKLRFQ